MSLHRHFLSGLLFAVLLAIKHFGIFLASSWTKLLISSFLIMYTKGLTAEFRTMGIADPISRTYQIKDLLSAKIFNLTQNESSAAVIKTKFMEQKTDDKIRTVFVACLLLSDRPSLIALFC